MLMLCEEEKRDKWKENPNYLYEEKFDGERALLYIRNNKIEKIITRRDINVLSRYPEFLSIAFNISNGMIDSEICVFQNGRSDFNLLSLRSHLKDEDKIKERAEIKPVIMAFDILNNGEDLTMKPLIKRKEFLSKAVVEGEFIKTAKQYETFEEIWKLVAEKELEGTIAKHKNSAYENKRSKYWVKLKNWKEIVLEFDNYENAVSEKFGFIKGITLTNQNGDRCACLGEKHKEVKDRLEREGSVKVNVQYLEKTNGDRHRFISFKEML
jgi:ATP-dependent DNA ligase